MRSLERRARRATALLLLAPGGILLAPGASGLAGCSPAPASRAPERAGDSPGWIDSATPASSTPGAAGAAARREERWDLAGQLRALAVGSGRARSEHLGGAVEGEVLAGAASGYPLRGPTASTPPGATLVERLFDTGGKEPTSYFVMIKHAPGYDPSGGDWEYLVVVPDGHVEERGKLALCARCHAEAPHDYVFGGGR